MTRLHNAPADRHRATAAREASRAIAADLSCRLNARVAAREKFTLVRPPDEFLSGTECRREEGEGGGMARYRDDFTTTVADLHGERKTDCDVRRETREIQTRFAARAHSRQFIYIPGRSLAIVSLSLSPPLLLSLSPVPCLFPVSLALFPDILARWRFRSLAVLRRYGDRWGATANSPMRMRGPR